MLHNEEATGNVLKEKTIAQKLRTREAAKLNKRGTLARGSCGTKPFLGHSSATRAQKECLSTKRVVDARFTKPLDSLVCASGIKSVAKVSSMRVAFDPKKAKVCAYQQEMLKQAL